jgi:hypothetical protein
MPTWWNLSLGLVAVLVLIRGVEHNSYFLIGLAGLLVGIGFLFKPVMAYFAIPMFLWLLITIQRGRTVLVSVASVLGVGLLGALVAPVPSVSRILLFWLPGSLSIFVIWSVAARNTDRNSEDLTSLRVVASAVFAAMVLTPAVLVVLTYAVLGRPEDLIRGWLVSPALRYEVTSSDVPMLLGVVILFVAIGLFFEIGRRMGHRKGVFILSLALLSVCSIVDWVRVGTTVVLSAIWLPLLLAALLVYRRNSLKPGDLGLLIGTSAATFAMVQVPVWNGYYTAYTIPAVLIGFLIISRTIRPYIAIGVTVLAFLFVAQSLQGRLFGPVAVGEPIVYTHLDVAHGDIDIPVAFDYYEGLVKRINELAEGTDVYSGPDSPEVIFLAGVPSATPVFFEALEVDWDNSAVVDLADTSEVIAINHEPRFSDPIGGVDLEQIYRELEQSEHFGPFELRWRSDG